MAESATTPPAAVPELLERELEIEALEAALAAVVAGAGRLAVIDGAAGIGKTALLRELRERAHAGGVAVLSARGGELERTFPFGVVRQLFEPVVARASAQDREAAFEGAAALAAPLFGTGPMPVSDLSDDESAFAVLHGLYWLTANLAERRPLMLAVDDLHWADVASLRWLAYLAPRLEGIRVLLAGTVRRLETDADPALAGLLTDPLRAPGTRPRKSGRSPRSRVRERSSLYWRDARTTCLQEFSGRGDPLSHADRWRSLDFEANGERPGSERASDLRSGDEARDTVLAAAA